MPQKISFQTEALRAPWELAGVAKATPVLLALSGGADSRMLLHLLAKWAERDGFSLTLAHVNHGIRGAEALRDRDFCQTLANQYGLELCILDADVPKLAKAHGRGLEEEARAVRYAYFTSLMEERSIPLLVTAHNADDNAETVLFRMARGSGLGGLGGISPTRPFASGTLVRPILSLTKQEVLSYCEEEGLEFVTDSTNTDTAYARNRLRAEVMPVLESLFPGAAQRIGEMSVRLREDEEVLASLAEHFLEAHCRDGRLPIKELQTLPRAIARRVTVKWLARFGEASVEAVHLDALERLAAAAAPHSALSMPGRVTVFVERGALCIRHAEKTPVTDYLLPFCKGVVELPDGFGSISVETGEKNLKVHNLSTDPYIILKSQSAIMESGLFWRPRREGDRILMGGMHREVRKLYREAGIPLDMRARIPLLCDADGIVWVPFCGVRDGVELAKEGLAVRLLIGE